MSTEPVVEIPFVAGFDESTRPEVLSPNASFTTLENVRQNTRGAVAKRLGFSDMIVDRPDGTDRTAGRRLVRHRDTFGVIDGTTLDMCGVSAISEWLDCGRVPEATVRRRTCPGIGSNITVTDCVVTANGLIAVAAQVAQTGGLLHPVVVVMDAAGTVINGPVVLRSNAGYPRLAVFDDNKILAFAIRGSIDPAEDIYAFYLDVANAASATSAWTTVGGAPIATDANSAGVFDVVGLSDRVALAYVNSNSVGSAQVTVRTYTELGQLEEVDLTTGVFTPSDVTMAEGDADNLWVAWAKLTSAGGPYVTEFEVTALDPNDIDGTPLGTTETILTTSRTESDNAHGRVWLAPLETNQVALYAVNRNAEQADGIYYRAAEISGGAVIATPLIGSKICGVSMVGRPFRFNGRVYAPLTGRAQEELVLCDVHPITGFEADDISLSVFRPVAAPLQQGLRGQVGVAPKNRTAFIDGTRAIFAFTIKTSGISIVGATSNSAAMVEYDFADPDRWHACQVNGSTYLGGGVVSIITGSRVIEANFLTRPKIVEVNVDNAGAQTFAVGRSYVATFEHRDADGNWHVSGVSDPVASGAITDMQVLVRIAPLAITNRIGFSDLDYGTGVRIGVWATTDGAQEPYHRIASVNNSTLLEYIEVEDTFADAGVEQGDLLYGTGNLPATGASQDHRAPLGQKHITSYNGMLVGANTSTVFFSSQPVDGEGQWWSPLFSQPVDSEVTGITVQDGAVLVFTKNGAWITSGEPPSDSLSLGGLSPLRRLAVDHGCVNSNGIVTTSVGTFFQSVRGIELLTRGLTIQPIGAPIQDTFAEFSWVSAATLDERYGLVRINLVGGEDDGEVDNTGVEVVYDLRVGAWVSKDIRYGNIANEGAQDAAMVTGEGDAWYAWLGTNGQVWVENFPGEGSLDGSAAEWVTMRAITSWVHIAGIHGEQFVDQVLLLLRRVTGCDLTISLAFDYSESYTSTHTWTAAMLDALSVREWLVKEIEQTTSSAVRVKIEDATPSSGDVGTGEGTEWIALTFNGIPHRGPKRSTGAQRGGS